jgi:hypothetical protein
MEAGLQELEALLSYLVQHNEAHAAEVMDLAARAKALGKMEAYDHMSRGVALLTDSNKSLREALEALED